MTDAKRKKIIEARKEADRKAAEAYGRKLAAKNAKRKSK